MSRKFLFATAAGAMLLAAPTLAAAAATEPVHHAQSGTAKTTGTAKIKMAAAKAAPAKTGSAKTAATKTATTKTASSQSAMTPTKAVHHHSSKTARNEHHRKTAENVSQQGDREVRALNALESAGYRQFNNLHANGANFMATAMKAGKSYDVTVTQGGQIQANRA